jgi:hypothetical protein
VKTIYKYPLRDPAESHHPPVVADRGVECSIEMPKGARVLSVGEQEADLVLWAIVDPEAPKAKRDFRVFGTGWKINVTELELGGWSFVGTVQMKDGLVFHVWVLG